MSPYDEAMSEPAIRLSGGPLACHECGVEIEEGYAPAVERDGGYELQSSEAVCASCGFNEIGFAGCAPTLADLESEAEALARFTLAGDSLGTSQITDTAE